MFHSYIYVFVHMNSYIKRYPYTYIKICLYIHILIHINIYIYIYKCTYIYIHVYLGQYSVGKTSFIRSLVKQDFPGQRIGPEPTTDRFTAIMHASEGNEGKYIYIYVNIYMNMYSYIYTYVYIYIFIYKYINKIHLRYAKMLIMILCSCAHFLQ
jgi:hypothetical protein